LSKKTFKALWGGAQVTFP